MIKKLDLSLFRHRTAMLAASRTISAMLEVPERAYIDLTRLMLAYAAGAGLWLLSPILGGAVSVTFALRSLCSALLLRIEAQLLSRIQLAGLSPKERSAADQVWRLHSRSILRSSTYAVSLTVGVLLAPALAYATGHPLRELHEIVMECAVIASVAVTVTCMYFCQSGKLIKPLVRAIWSDGGLHSGV